MHQPKDVDWLDGYKTRLKYICCLQQTDHRPMDIYRLKVRGPEHVLHTNVKS